MICATCGKEFDPPRKLWNQRYCNPKCRPSVISKPTMILLRDHFKCFYCGRSAFEDGIILAVDHLRPISYGGEPIAANLVTSCRDCNTAKRDKLIAPPLLTEMITEIARRNAAFGLAPEREFSMSQWYQTPTGKKQRRKAYEELMQEYASPAPEA